MNKVICTICDSITPKQNPVCDSCVEVYDQLRAENERLREDKILLDFLQKLTEHDAYTKKVKMRWSETNRGWRLHSTSRNNAFSDVREAIRHFKKKEDLKALAEGK